MVDVKFKKKFKKIVTLKDLNVTKNCQTCELFRGVIGYQLQK